MGTIAIIGIGCRFPGRADGPQALWRLLCEGRSTLASVPASRWVAGADAAARGSFLDEVKGFDAGFFRIAPAEAARLDPQQRLLLETTWEALEDASIPPLSLAGSRTSVHIGIASSDYGRLQTSAPNDAYAMTGSARSIAANRLSYFFDWRGVSMAVDTACSSSLVALHLGCQGLEAGDADVAVAGGVNLMLGEAISAGMAKIGALSKSGQVRAFDAKADGYVRGEGAGVLVLKRLADALRDRDPIWALVRGSATNQDGRTNGLTAPSGAAQEGVLREAYRRAGVSPASVGYVEAHGTGTPLGDPIEARALGAVLGPGRVAPCALGSVKTNIGHLEAAAGVAGLIKAALMVNQGEVPASLHYETPSPHIDFEGLKLRVPQRLAAWDGPSPRRAGVSGFGFGGTNAHVVLEEPPPTERQRLGPRADVVLLSARDPAALDAQEAAWRAANAPVGALAATSALGRSHLDARRALVFAAGAAPSSVPFAKVSGRRVGGKAPQVAFIFPGQGAQWGAMGRVLLERDELFGARLGQVDAALQPLLGWSVGARVRADDEAGFDDVAVAQPMLFAMQVALAEVLLSYGVEPQAVVGHSLGEVAAAHVSGALSLADAARVVVLRSGLMARTRGRGSMLAVECSALEAREHCAAEEGRVVLAVDNGPRSVVLSGEPAALEALGAKLTARGVFCRRVRVDVASHGPQMQPLAGELREGLVGLRPAAPRWPWLSSVSPGDAPAGDGAYWVRNLCEPVRFREAAELLQEQGHDALVEVSPHPLLAFGLEQAGARRRVVVCPMERGVDAEHTLLRALAGLWVQGVPVNWGRRVSRDDATREAPRTRFMRTDYWFDLPLPVLPAQSVAPAAVWAGLPEGERRPWLTAQVTAQAASLLGLEASALEPERALSDFGLDSLMGARLRAWLEGSFGVAVPLSQLLRASTGALVNAVLEGDRRPAGQCAEWGARFGSSEAPWLLVHPGGLEDSVFEALAPVGVRLLRVHPEHAPSLEALVEAAADLAGAASPAPLRLAGWSLGAVVAHQLVARLSGRGHRVEALVLLDPIELGPSRAVPGPREWAASLFGLLTARAGARRPPLQLEAGLDEVGVRQRLREGLVAAGLTLDEPTLGAVLHEFQRSIARSFGLVQGFEPTPPGVPTRVIRATASVSGAPRGPRLGWDGLGPAAWVDLDAHHYSLPLNPGLAACWRGSAP